MSDMCFVSSCANEWPHLHIMPLEELMALPTAEIRPDEWFSWNGWDKRHESYLEHKRSDREYRSLAKSVEAHGFHPGFAPEVIDGEIQEGHHRITMFYDMNTYWVPWQDQFNDDQYNDNWNHYVYGRSEEAWTTLMSNA